MAVCAGSGVINTRTCAEEFIKIIACAAGKYRRAQFYKQTRFQFLPRELCLGVVIMSVRPSVRPSHAFFVTNPKNLPAMFYTI